MKLPEHYELNSRLANVRYLYESIHEIRNQTSRKRKVLLTLLYWKVFDEIDIPANVMQEILSKATNPETIFRSLRHVNTSKEQRDLKGETNE